VELTEASVRFLEALELSGRARATLALYERNLKELEAFLGTNGKPLAVEEITPMEVRGFLLHLSRRKKKPGFQYRTEPKDGLALGTRRAYFRTLSSFFGWCEREGLLNGHQPMHNVEKPKLNRKKVRIITKAQMEAFLKILDKPSPQKQTLRLAFVLMHRLGLRIGEVTTLKLANFKVGYVKIEGKGGKEREIPIVNGLDRILEDYITNIRPQFDKGLSDTLLLSWTGKPLTTSSLRKSFKRYAKRAGIEDATPHTLRHTFATTFQNEVGNMLILKELLGHASISTTEMYYHGSPEARREALSKVRF